MYEIIIWDGKPETAERILKIVGKEGFYAASTFRLFVADQVMLAGEHIVATDTVWWKESKRYPRQVEKAGGEKQCAQQQR